MNTEKSIEPESTIKAGNWYVCDCEMINENQTVAFHRDETYYCPKDGFLDVRGCLFKVGAFDIDFRPATEKETLKAKYGITGIGSKKAEGKLGEMISQRMESAKAKEALLPDRELSEFEKAVQQTISSYQFLPHDIDHCVQREDAFNFYKKAASCLLSIAYKKFIEEACEWLDENLINYWSQAYTDNCDFIEDFRKALEKGV